MRVQLYKNYICISDSNVLCPLENIWKREIIKGRKEIKIETSVFLPVERCDWGGPTSPKSDWVGRGVWGEVQKQNVCLPRGICLCSVKASN